jgi:hypothetical protein
MVIETTTVPVERKETPCSFGHGDIAIARYALPRGCAARPDDRVQDLCAQHIASATPIEGMVLQVIFQPEMFDTFFGNT